jgi:hypothetical protein
MTRIRMPRSALPLLVYCKTNSAKRDDACFSSYAELIVFLASYGFKISRGRVANVSSDMLESGPDPIEFTVFKNQGLFSQILLMGLVVSKGHSIAKNEAALGTVIETLASLGSSELARMLSTVTPDGFLFGLIELISQSLESTQ